MVPIKASSFHCINTLSTASPRVRNNSRSYGKEAKAFFFTSRQPFSPHCWLGALGLVKVRAAHPSQPQPLPQPAPGLDPDAEEAEQRERS